MRYVNLFLVASMSMALLTACPSDSGSNKALLNAKNCTKITIGPEESAFELTADKIEKIKNEDGSTSVKVEGLKITGEKKGPAAAYNCKTELNGELDVTEKTVKSIFGN